MEVEEMTETQPTKKPEIIIHVNDEGEADVAM